MIKQYISNTMLNADIHNLSSTTCVMIGGGLFLYGSYKLSSYLITKTIDYFTKTKHLGKSFCEEYNFTPYDHKLAEWLDLHFPYMVKVPAHIDGALGPMMEALREIRLLPPMSITDSVRYAFSNLFRKQFDINAFTNVISRCKIDLDTNNRYQQLLHDITSYGGDNLLLEKIHITQHNLNVMHDYVLTPVDKALVYSILNNNYGFTTWNNGVELLQYYMTIPMPIQF